MSRLCIVRSNAPSHPGRAGAVLALASCLSLACFAAGFVASRYLIDRELADSTQVLNRSAHAYELQQALFSQQLSERYAQLDRRIAAFRAVRGVAHGRR